jgi:hypothetical protein
MPHHSVIHTARTRHGRQAAAGRSATSAAAGHGALDIPATVVGLARQSKSVLPHPSPAVSPVATVAERRRSATPAPGQPAAASSSYERRRRPSSSGIDPA